MKKYYLFLLFFISVTVHAENDKAFFWQVSSDKATVYLLGSIHFADKSFYPIRKEIEEGYKNSDALVVELDITKIDHNVYNRLLVEKGIYKDGSTIKDVISEDTWQQLDQRLRQLNISYDDIKNYKPGILVLTLTSMQVMQMGFNPELGIDAYFLNKASSADTAKKIIELETLNQQVSLFLDIPDGNLLLKESLYSLDESEAMMADLVRYWKAGDEGKMNKLLFEDALSDNPAFSAIYDSLIYERNSQMSLKIDAMLKQQGSYFVVVGSGHLIGDRGIVGLLKEKGYEVERR
ncbi:MAG: TraB/GumN family protein [Proteobacteria bacterium]|nr:TraB/GumN family protein [Pseudomonadota bacterium]